jgi:histidinol-phosphatase
MAEHARSLLEVALAICDEADAVSLELFRTGVTARRKQDSSFVTDADLRIETLARERIGAAFPDHGIVGEEFGTGGDPASGIRWYIDPIDATHNFMRGIPVFATLLAVEDADGMLAAAVSAPALGARWYAARGEGSWRQATFRGAVLDDELPRRLAVSSVDRIEDAHIVTSSTVELALDRSLPGFLPTVARAWRERGFGDFWGYTFVAEGVADAMIEVGMNAWDLAPLQLLVEEAGGRFTDLEGVRTIHGRGAIASNGPLHDQLVRDLARGKAQESTHDSLTQADS